MMLRIIKSCLVSKYSNDLSNHKRGLILCDIIFEQSKAVPYPGVTLGIPLIQKKTKDGFSYINDTPVCMKGLFFT